MIANGLPPEYQQSTENSKDRAVPNTEKVCEGAPFCPAWYPCPLHVTYNARDGVKCFAGP